VAVVAGAAAYLQRQNPSSDSYESSGVIASVGDAFYWIKSKISGALAFPHDIFWLTCNKKVCS